MLIEILYIFLRLILLSALQVIVLDNVQLNYFINPYLYILFIILLPVNMPRGLVMIISFAYGLLIGWPTNTSGLHALACTVMSYLRPYILKLIAPREGYEAEAKPTMREMGLQWFLSYSALMVLAHHIILFYFEVFRLSEFFTTMARVLLSAIFTMLLIMISVYMFYKPKSQR